MYIFLQTDTATVRYGELLQKGEPTLHHVCLMSVYMKFVAARKNEEYLSTLKVSSYCFIADWENIWSV